MTRWKCSLGLTLVLSIWSAVLPQPMSAEEETKSLLATAYEKTQSAKTLTDFTAVIDLCQQAEATNLTPEQRKYARQLASWGYNRRGEAYVEEAAAVLETGDKARAAELDKRALGNFEKAVENDETRWKAYHNRGVSYALAGKYEESIADFTRVTELRPDYPNSWFNRGEIRYELGRYDEAIADYDKTLELTPEDFGAFTSRGHTNFRLKKFDEALRDYARAVELDDANAEAYANRGDAYQKLGQWKEAASDFRRAVELAPTLPRAYASAAWLMVTCPDERFRHAELGLQAAREAVKLGGREDFELLDILAAAEANASRFDDAAVTVTEAIELAPETVSGPLAERLDLYKSSQPYRQPVDRTARAATSERR